MCVFHFVYIFTGSVGDICLEKAVGRILFCIESLTFSHQCKPFVKKPFNNSFRVAKEYVCVVVFAILHVFFREVVVGVTVMGVYSQSVFPGRKVRYNLIDFKGGVINFADTFINC